MSRMTVCMCGAPVRPRLGEKPPIRCAACLGEKLTPGRQSNGAVNDASWMRGYAAALAEVTRHVVPVRLDVVREAVAGAAKNDGVTLAMMRAANVERLDLVRLRGVIPEGE